jgi:tRNA(His) guanylyltransferase
MSDDLGDRMKLYEGREAQRRALPRLPIVVRIDGKGFSRWTKGLVYPFDERLEKCRRYTMRALIKETGALIGYGQSDEMSFVLYSGDPKSQIYCDGRYQKIVSHTASMAANAWRDAVALYIPEKVGVIANFDSRAWELPSLEEATNALMWREWDATKNSVSMAARSVYSHKEVNGKNGSEMQDMLMEKGLNWNDYPTWAKRGTYMGRRSYDRVLTPEELAQLPLKHNARANPNMVVTRSEIQVLDLPPMSKVVNRIEVLLGAEPRTLDSPQDQAAPL